MRLTPHVGALVERFAARRQMLEWCFDCGLRSKSSFEFRDVEKAPSKNCFKLESFAAKIEHVCHRHLAIDCWPRACALAACSYLPRKSTYEYGSVYINVLFVAACHDSERNDVTPYSKSFQKESANIKCNAV